MRSPPQDIKLKRAEGVLAVLWDGGTAGRCSVRTLRCGCRCAGCVNEHTGVRTLDPETVPKDIAVRDMQLVGNYAARFVFSDGHDTGIYSWDLLHRLTADANEPENADSRPPPTLTVPSNQ